MQGIKTSKDPKKWDRKKKKMLAKEIKRILSGIASSSLNLILRINGIGRIILLG